MHRIWQRSGKYPTEILQIPPEKVLKEGLQAFIFASELVAIEEESKSFSCPFLSKKGGG